ncbi:MAG TPA: glycosyltransferase family 4 protein [Dokdonella sp.]
MKPRVAIVVQRWAPDMAGGSEALAWQYAELLADAFEVELLTSTARDYVSWAGVFPEGAQASGRVVVRRFAPAFTRGAYFFALHARALGDWRPHEPASERARTVWTSALQEELIKFQGPWCPGLLDHLEAHADAYAAIVLTTYLYPTSYFAARRLPRHKLLLAPTLHDEAMAYLPAFARYRERIGRFLWLTDAERALAGRLWGVDAGEVVGMAIDAKTAAPAESDGPYLLYCGRLDAQKGTDRLLDAFASYRALHPERRLKLVLTGSDALGLRATPGVEFLGFVDEARKLALMAGAAAFVQPSRYESFSIVTLEAMAQGTPILVNAECEVLAEHARRSGAGFAFRGEDELHRAIDAVLALDADARAELGRRGRDYVHTRYGRERVRDALVAEVRAVAGA